TLYVDGQQIAINGTSQTFNTPALDANRVYFYEMKAVVAKEGQNQVASKRVEVRGGQTVNVNLRQLTAEAPKAAPARVSVTPPDEAKLYVDGVLTNAAPSPRQFNTPNLEPGKSFYYTFKAEVTREGRTISQTQKVNVSAGKQVNVEFKELSSTTSTASR